jgi:hypothetical protein
MTLNQLYEKYFSWTGVGRALSVSITSLRNWRKKGFIPIKSQLEIEKKTNGAFVASLDDVKK